MLLQSCGSFYQLHFQHVMGWSPGGFKARSRTLVANSGERDVVEPHLLSCNTSCGELHLHLCKSYFQVGRPEGRMFDIHHDYCPGSSSFFLCHVSLASSMLDLFAIQMNSDTRVMLKITWTELRRVFQNTKNVLVQRSKFGVHHTLFRV